MKQLLACTNVAIHYDDHWDWWFGSHEGSKHPDLNFEVFGDKDNEGNIIYDAFEINIYENEDAMDSMTTVCDFELTQSWLGKKDEEKPSEYEEIEARLWELAETDISRQLQKKKEEHYHSFIKPGVKVWWNDPAGESSDWFYVDSIEDDGYPWGGNRSMVKNE